MSSSDSNEQARAAGTLQCLADSPDAAKTAVIKADVALVQPGRMS